MWDGSFYEQTDGVVMGSPLSPVVANLFTERFGSLSTETAGNKPTRIIPKKNPTIEELTTAFQGTRNIDDDEDKDDNIQESTVRFRTGPNGKVHAALVRGEFALGKSRSPSVSLPPAQCFRGRRPGPNLTGISRH
ncbi:hypothetical protein Trydic_g3194 [Trypoxylus dichotomus]